MDNFSAYEALQQLAAEQAQAAPAAPQNAAAAQQNAPAAAEKKQPGLIEGFLGGLFGSRKKANQGLGYDLADSIGNKINKQVTNAISRSVMGVIKNMMK